MELTTYNFSIVISGVRADDQEVADDVCEALFEAGCDDAIPVTYNSTLYLSFDRESDFYEQAVITAIRDIESVDGLKAVSVDAGDWVGLSDAAELAETTRAAISNFNKGQRGDGTFPHPVQRLSSRNPLWRWSDIAEWLLKQGKIESELVENAKVTEMINVALQMREQATLDRVCTIATALNHQYKHTEMC